MKNAVASVTVLATHCISADAWATALLVAGPADGLALAQRVGLEAMFLLRRDTALVEVGLGRFALPVSAAAQAGRSAGGAVTSPTIGRQGNAGLR